MNSRSEQLGKWLVRALVGLAKEELAKANQTCGNDWPAQQRWSDLSSTSQALFMQRARKTAGIADEAYLIWLRTQTDFDADQLWQDLIAEDRQDQDTEVMEPRSFEISSPSAAG
jgi:hypothetical protein